jgi:hypothetical protein
MPRFTLVLFALGILLQGCSLQKRSLMPGWSVERIAKASTTPDESAVEGANHTAVIESLEIHAESTVPLQDPLIPMKALMGYSPTIEGVPELRIPHIPQPVDAFEALPIANAGIAGQQATRNAKAPGGLIAALLRLTGLLGGVLGVLILVIGIAFENFLTGLVGLALFLIAIRIGLSVENPQAKWRLRAVERHRMKQQNQKDRPEEMAERKGELEARRAAQSEELQLKQERKMKEQQERRLQQEAEQQARKANRQALFQKPFVKIALGFGGIIGLYLLLF